MELVRLVHALAIERAVLRWNGSEEFYEVIDARSFESKISKLLHKRRKGVDIFGGPDHFKELKEHFVLVRGSGWNIVGSAFRLKMGNESISRRQRNPGRCNLNSQPPSLLHPMQVSYFKASQSIRKSHRPSQAQVPTCITWIRQANTHEKANICLTPRFFKMCNLISTIWFSHSRKTAWKEHPISFRR